MKQTPGGRTLTPDFTIEQSPGTQGVTDVQQILARERQSMSHTVPVYWAGDHMMTPSLEPGHQEKMGPIVSGAVITSNGKLTPGFEYIAKLR